MYKTQDNAQQILGFGVKECLGNNKSYLEGRLEEVFVMCVVGTGNLIRPCVKAMFEHFLKLNCTKLSKSSNLI